MTRPDVTVLDAQAILELELDGVKLIEASAGTGKTHTIADLYLRHLLDGREVSQILVVTFTNATTEELRGRIQDRLYEALALIDDPSREALGFMALWIDRWQSLDPESQAQQLGRLQLALRSFDEASISTIHSFCQYSLQDHALAGNQRFESEFVSDDEDIWHAAIRDWWRKLSYELDPVAWQFLADHADGLNKLTRDILYLRNKPSAKLLPESDQPLAALLDAPMQLAHTLHQLRNQWIADKAEIIDILRHSKVLDRRKNPYRAARIDCWLEAADEFFIAPAAGMPFELFEFMGTEWLNKNSTEKKRGQDPRVEHAFFRAIDDIARRWLALGEQLGPCLRIEGVHAVTSRVRQTKRESGVLAFQDQLDLLLEALLSPSGERLARQLRQQYPVAMIDEFQDTDDVQFRIFERIYLAGEDSSLTLIGDPKQAIYSFRGGDIFTYMQARHIPAIRHYNLAVNWRSQPDLVNAVNSLFSLRDDSFVYPGSIDFRAVASNPENERYRLQSNASAAPALTLWRLPQDDQGENYSRNDLRELVNAAVVSEIGGLLAASARGAASIDGKPVKSGDIAILVRTAYEGQALAELLRARGIRSVTIGRDSVFASDEALGLYELLLAVSQCSDPLVARRSLTSSLLQLDYRDIAAIVDDDRRWQDWQEDLAELQQLWQRQGFIAAFQSLLRHFDITRRMARAQNSARRITNLLHLAELLQQQSLTETGQLPLLRWFETQFDARGSEDAELRLEDDEALVKIVTIHKSKGLQYPIVFVPFLWTCRQIEKSGPIYFHDGDYRACIDLGSSAQEQHHLVAEKERLAEDLRLLYVALTRARSRVYLAWGCGGPAGKPGYASRTALAYLLHSQQSHTDLGTNRVDGFAAGMDFDADLQRLVERGAGSIDCRDLPRAAALPAEPAARDVEITPQLTRFDGGQPTQWRVNSFTALTRAVHQPPAHGARSSSPDPILDFPAGSHVGLLLHSLLEHLDFEAAVEPQCEPLFRHFLPQYGVADDFRPTLLQWLEQILQTPLNDDGLALQRIAGHRRLNELEFDFALDRLDVDALNGFLQARHEQPLQALSGADFRGLVTGVIDLVFEYEGRYYLADYKSNYLGGDLDDYQPDRLRQAMLERRYDLQSMLYALALHRLLATRLPDYDYARHFGGSYYLFLRAMRSRHGPRFGVHFERPEAAEIREFDALFRFTSPAAPAS